MDKLEKKEEKLKNALMPRAKAITSKKIDVDILLSNIKGKFNLSDKDIEELSVKKDIKIPVEIFTKKLGMLESISLYLHEQEKLSFSTIARLLQRNYNTIWTSYHKAKKKNE